MLMQLVWWLSSKYARTQYIQQMFTSNEGRHTNTFVVVHSWCGESRRLLNVMPTMMEWNGVEGH